MLIWRLSTAQYAEIFDGGYGLFNNGRWNSRGNRITYCATSPALCVLEKLVHVEDIMLLPPLKMMAYKVPDDIAHDEISLSALPRDWMRQNVLTQRIGDNWLASAGAALMTVPSAVLPISNSPDMNMLINHGHPDALRITVESIDDFTLDARLL